MKAHQGEQRTTQYLILQAEQRHQSVTYALGDLRDCLHRELACVLIPQFAFSFLFFFFYECFNRGRGCLN